MDYKLHHFRAEMQKRQVARIERDKTRYNNSTRDKLLNVVSILQMKMSEYDYHHLKESINWLASQDPNIWHSKEIWGFMDCWSNVYDKKWIQAANKAYLVTGINLGGRYGDKKVQPEQTQR